MINDYIFNLFHSFHAINLRMFSTLYVTNSRNGGAVLMTLIKCPREAVQVNYVGRMR